MAPSRSKARARVKGAPRIHFTRDTMPFLHLAKETGADVVGLDWRVDVAHARATLGTVPIQGNLDPIALFGPPETITRKVNAICQR